MSFRILVVFSGGTIGSTAKNGAIGAETGKARQLLQRFSIANPGADVVFDSVEPITMLSENSRPQDWCTIADAILGVNLNDYSGVIVTHGTDTLAWTSSALSYLLGGVRIPVIVVASNQPLEHPDANGSSNFADAVSLIAMEKFRGVLVVYRNPDGRRRVHLGARLVPARHLSHDFLSFGDTEFGEFYDDQFRGSNTLGNPSLPDSQVQPPACPPEFEPRVSDDVLYLQPYPGLDYDRINLSVPTSAVVHDLYHSGTGCVNPGQGRLSVLSFAERCLASNIPLFLTPIPPSGDLYETTLDMIERGAIPLRGISAQSAFVKVVLAAGNWPSDNEQIVSSVVRATGWAHEFIVTDALLGADPETQIEASR